MHADISLSAGIPEATLAEVYRLSSIEGLQYRLLNEYRVRDAWADGAREAGTLAGRGGIPPWTEDIRNRTAGLRDPGTYPSELHRCIQLFEEGVPADPIEGPQTVEYGLTFIWLASEQLVRSHLLPYGPPFPGDRSAREVLNDFLVTLAPTEPTTSRPPTAAADRHPSHTATDVARAVNVLQRCAGSQRPSLDEARAAIATIGGALSGLFERLVPALAAHADPDNAAPPLDELRDLTIRADFIVRALRPRGPDFGAGGPASVDEDPPARVEAELRRCIAALQLTGAAHPGDHASVNEALTTIADEVEVADGMILADGDGRNIRFILGHALTAAGGDAGRPWPLVAARPVDALSTYPDEPQPPGEGPCGRLVLQALTDLRLDVPDIFAFLDRAEAAPDLSTWAVQEDEILPGCSLATALGRVGIPPGARLDDAVIDRRTPWDEQIEELRRCVSLIYAAADSAGGDHQGVEYALFVLGNTFAQALGRPAMLQQVADLLRGGIR